MSVISLAGGYAQSKAVGHGHDECAVTSNMAPGYSIFMTLTTVFQVEADSFFPNTVYEQHQDLNVKFQIT